MKNRGYRANCNRLTSLIGLVYWEQQKVFTGAGILLILTVMVFTRIGSTFMPTMDEGDIIVQLEKLPSITLAQSVALDGQVQKTC